MATLLQDLRYAIRMLLKAPGFVLVAVITLALGIGANTALFSVIEAVLLRELPFREPDRLMYVWENNFKRGRGTNVVGPANFVRWRERNQSFEQLTALTEWSANVIGSGEPERVPIGYVTPEYFDTLGAHAAIGRVFNVEDGKQGQNNVVVLSHGYWQRLFGGDSQVVGKAITLNDSKVTVVGVMPAGFRGLMNVELWGPVVIREEHRNFRGRYMTVIGRLKPGVTRDQAQTEMAGIAKQIEQELPDFTGGWGVNVMPLREHLVGDVKPALLILFGAVGFVLLIACGNVANLLLARATGRARELAVRTALGAPRWRLVRQLLTESVLLALAGGAAGVLLALWGVSWLRAILPADLGRFTEIQMNPPVFLFTMGIALLTGILFGTAPALAATRGPLQASLREGTQGAGHSAGRQRLRKALVISEVALSLVLLVGAGLLLKSFSRLAGVDAGFQSNVLSMQLTLASAKYREDAQIAQFYDRVVAEVETLPGVTAAGAMSWLPLGRGSATSYQVVGEAVPPPGQEPVADVRIVTPRVFETMGIPLLRGRTFTAADDAKAPKRVIINQTMAREHWPNEDPVGKRITMSWGEEIPAEVIGVVGDVRLASLDTAARATLYWHQPQLPNNFMSLMIRSQQDPMTLARAARERIAALDPELPVAKIQTLEQVRSESLNAPRFTMLLLALFAAVALTLAAVGIYGLMAYSVSQRTHEIGIRMALGAQRGQVLSMVLSQGTVLAAAGLIIGVTAALVLARILETKLKLFETNANDPLTFTAVAVLLMAVAVLACFVPAYRATRVDPMIALRYE